MEAAMLDQAHRLRRRTDFATAIRQGRRAGRGTLVVHLHRPEQPGYIPPDRSPSTAGGTTSGPLPRAGFIVPRAVGGAVVRNTIRRRLRHLVRVHLAELPAGSMLVVRALPAAAGARSTRLDADLTAALRAAARTPHASASSATRARAAAPAAAAAREPAP
jgi:ribonuclease P protein component